jgi:LysM repeat protein
MKHIFRLLAVVALIALALPFVAPVQAQCTPRADWGTYTVVAGDTLNRIARRVGTTVNELYTGNCLTSSRILVGQVLRVPGGAAPVPSATAAPVTVTIPSPGGTFQTRATYLPFQTGFMIWRADTNAILVFGNNGLVGNLSSQEYGGLPIPDTTAALPPPGVFFPNSPGFARVWHNVSWAQQWLGFATSASETGYDVLFQQPSFGRFFNISLPDGRLARVNLDGTWLRIEATATPTQIGQPSLQTGATFQAFENGFMVWRADNSEIRVYFGGDSGTLFILNNLEYGNLPALSGNFSPPPGQFLPSNGFGRVWGNDVETRSRLGYATTSEQGYTMALVSSGAAIVGFSLPDGRVLYGDQAGGSWRFGGDIYAPAPTLNTTPTSTPLVTATTTAVPSITPVATENAFQVGVTFQDYEGGFMLWRSDNNSIWVFDQQRGRVLLYESERYGNLPIDTTTPVPQGRVRPLNGMGRVWSNFNEVWSALGWPYASESGYTARITLRSDGAVQSITLPEGGAQLTNMGGNNSWAITGPDGIPAPTPSAPVDALNVTPGTRVPEVAAVTAAAPIARTAPATFQCFIGGYMLLLGDTGQVFALTGLNGGQATFVEQAQYASLPDPVTVELAPLGEFGKVWTGFESIRTSLDWATYPARSFETVISPTLDPNTANFSLANGFAALEINFQTGAWSVPFGNLQEECLDPTDLLQTLAAPTGTG